MAKSIWKGVITFGMVSIPVKLYTAARSKDLSFNQIHTKCNSRIKYKKWCPTCEVEVPADEIVKGYEYAKNQYVLLEERDLENLPVPSKHAIHVDAFVKSEDVDPVYYEKSYYLEPEAGGAKPYTLLKELLSKKNMQAIGKITIHERESLCSLRSHNGVLIMETLFYPDEISVPKKLDVELPEVEPRELEMASQLADYLFEEFHPEKYHDEYREKLQEAIQAKIQGKEFIVAEAPPSEPKVIDLMEALKASVESAKKEKKGKEKAG